MNTNLRAGDRVAFHSRTWSNECASYLSFDWNGIVLERFQAGQFGVYFTGVKRFGIVHQKELTRVDE